MSTKCKLVRIVAVSIGDTVVCRYTGEEFAVVDYDDAALVTLSDGTTRIIGELARKPAAGGRHGS